MDNSMLISTEWGQFAGSNGYYPGKIRLFNIFEPFIRAKNAGEIKGSGLGLSIVKRAVELQGGEIKVTSKLNEGTAFTIILPVKHNE